MKEGIITIWRDYKVNISRSAALILEKKNQLNQRSEKGD